MSDNIQILDANGNVITTATDQVGTVHIQKVKIINGASDSAVPINAGEGDEANALRVVLGGDRLVRPHAALDDLVVGVSSDIIDTTGVAVVAAQGINIKFYMTSLVVTNNDTDISTVVRITDGNGGAVKWRNTARKDGGGFSVQFPTPIPFSANTAVYAKCETTGASVQVSISGFKGG